MPSRLSSLLVRDGLVGVKRMEKAFQRQVIYGGSLDTILLEMNLVPEERLTQYLALASGLPPAARDEGQVVEPAAIALMSRDMAEQYRAVPLAIEGEAIRLLVCSPLEITELEDLADLVDRPLQPLITPEYRWHLVLASAYGLDPPARFTTLARSLDVDPTTTPVGRARTVIVDPVIPAPVAIEVTDRTPVPPVVAEVDTEVIELPSRDEIARGRRHTLIGLAPNRAATESGAVREVPRPGEHDAAIQPIVSFAEALTTASVPISEATRALERTKSQRRSPTAPISTEGRDAPLPVVRARELLATAEDRDTVFLTLLRAARGRARWAGLLTVQGGAAIGRVALAEPGLDVTQVPTVLIPLDTVSPFRTVVSNHQPHIGPIVTGDPGIDAMILRMGGTIPPSALILPVLLRDRVVALVIAHRVHSDTRLADVTELLPIATAASDALGRLIVKHKAAGYRAPSEAPLVELDAEQIATKRLVRPAETTHEVWKAPDDQPSQPGFEQGTELSIDAEPPRPIDEVLRDRER